MGHVWMFKAVFTKTVLPVMAFSLAVGVTAANAGAGSMPRFARNAASTESIQIAERRRLVADEIRKRLVGQAMRRESQGRSRRGGTGRRASYLVVRPDGSLMYKCEWYSEKQYAWTLCRGFTKGNLRNGFTNGVWSIKGNSICLRATTTKYEACYAVYDDGAGVLFKRVKDSVGVLDGSYEFLNETRLDCVGYLKSGNC